MMSISADEVRRAKVLNRYEYKKTSVVVQLVAFIIFVINDVVLFFNYLAPMKTSIWETSKYTAEQRMKTIYLFLSIVGFFLAVLVFIKVPALKKTTLCITEKGVYGCAGKAFYFSTQSFTIPLDQITRVYAKGNSLFIESGGTNYQCIIESSFHAEMRIRDLLFKGKTESSDYNAKDNQMRNDSGTIFTQVAPTGNQWKCSNCGRVNDDFVGTCGCGTQKNSN